MREYITLANATPFRKAAVIPLLLRSFSASCMVARVPIRQYPAERRLDAAVQRELRQANRPKRNVHWLEIDPPHFFGRLRSLPKLPIDHVSR